MREEEVEKDEMKEIEDNLVKLTRQALDSGNLKIAHQHIMDILTSEYSQPCVDRWGMNYYLLLSTPEQMTAVEKLTKEYLDKIQQKYWEHTVISRVSYFSERQLNLIDEAFERWQECTNHYGENAKDLFVDFIKSKVSLMEERGE